MTGNAQRGAIAAAPYVFTIVFFVLWEAACRLFNIPVFFLPARLLGQGREIQLYGDAIGNDSYARTEIIVVQRCLGCGHTRRNRSAADDDREALLALFGRPVPDPH